MSRFSARTWNVPQVTMFPPAVRDSEDFGLSEYEGLDPGPLGLVAARIQLFDERGRDPYGSSPSIFHLLNEGTSQEQKGSRTLGYQAKKTKKNVPEYVTLSRYQPPNSVLLGADTIADNRTRARLSAIFNSTPVNKESEKVEELYQKLSEFSLFGLPRLAENLRDDWEIREGEESRIHLQNSWRDIVKGHEKISRRQNHQQEAIWELLHTELTYLRKLKIITNLFISGLLNLQSIGILQEVDPRQIFSNIQEIIRLHRQVWQEVMWPVLNKARISGNPLDPILLCQGLQTFPEQFHSYIHYCLSEAHCLQYTHVTQQNNKLFAMYVKWAETHKQSNRMRLNDMLVKPHQRLTKYPLLLRAILKKTEDPITRETISSTLAIVENFIRSIDSQMQIREEQQKLEMIAKRICQYDVVDSSSDEVDRNVKELSILDLTLPMVGIGPHYVRMLMQEGSLKMKEGRDSKTEVHCLLFTDLFLITKPLKKGNRAKVIRQPLMLDKIISRELKDPGTFLLMYVNELHSVVAAYTFQAPSSSLCKDWIDSLSAAQKQLELLRSREAWMCQAQFKQMQENQESAIRDRNSPNLCRRNPSNGDVSLSDRSSPRIPQVILTPPENPDPETDDERTKKGRVSPGSPRRCLPGRSRSPGRVGAQRVIERRLRKENGTPKQSQRAEGPEIQLQDVDREQAEPTDGPVIQPQDVGREQAEPTEGPIFQYQDVGREQAEPTEGPVIQPQDVGREQAVPMEGPVIQPQDVDFEKAEPTKGPLIQSQDVGREQVESSEGPVIQSQFSNRVHEETAESLKIQAPVSDRAQDNPDSGSNSQPQSPDWNLPEVREREDPSSSGPCQVMEILRRAKAMKGRLPGQAGDAQDAVEGEKPGAVTSPQRILTLAELQRIRSPLNLNSTLTISEV
ncbi:pleckstrin homology domain-containing family G member 5-like [Scyliorhinus canicula]|uniref:pleckstrin homology domain-containing family G member 5-like n=1 Tax=Scyliorhinus canicula TaxID=7830 RepID=UPI0018F737C4|nr:pleckstrin homology domain-containing family G member 5-like [Scyliorhinus canicula]